MAAQRFEMWVLYLDVKKCEACGSKLLHEHGKGDFRRVGAEVEHRLARKHPADGESVDPAHQNARIRRGFPNFDAVGPPELVKAGVAFDKFRDNPCTFGSRFTAELHDLRKGTVDRDLVGVAPQRAP